MPNRILKESICVSDDVDKLSWFEEVLFYRLIVNCDDYGRFDGRAAIIKNRLFPLKENLTVKAVSEAISKLASAGLVALYVFEGKPYLYLPGWNHHQNVRAKKSKYPEPGNLPADANECLQSEEEAGESGDERKAHENICKQMNTDEIKGNPMHNKESKGKRKNTNVPVIQSNTKSESVSESESYSESLSGEVGSEAGATHARFGETGVDFGGKENECLRITRADGRQSYGMHQHIYLTAEEHARLVADFGETNVECMIIRMDRWMEETPEDQWPLGGHYEALRKKLWKENRDG